MGVKQLFDLTGKVALVTGGSRGLGLQIAEALGDMGARVAISARNEKELDAAAATLTERGIEVLTVVNDLADPAGKAAEQLITAVLGRFSRIDILVNNAGTVWGAPAETHTIEAWRKVMALNVDACFQLAQQVATRSMIPNGGGKIINIASIAGLQAALPETGVRTIAYNTSKGAVISFTRALAAEWGRHNINVNAILPGYFPSKLSEGLSGLADALRRSTPLGRVGGDEDMKGIAAFLASEASRHVTGAAIPVDGGVTLV